MATRDSPDSVPLYKRWEGFVTKPQAPRHHSSCAPLPPLSSPNGQQSRFPNNMLVSSINRSAAEASGRVAHDASVVNPFQPDKHSGLREPRVVEAAARALYTHPSAVRASRSRSRVAVGGAAPAAAAAESQESQGARATPIPQEQEAAAAQPAVRPTDYGQFVPVLGQLQLQQSQPVQSRPLMQRRPIPPNFSFNSRQQSQPVPIPQPQQQLQQQVQQEEGPPESPPPTDPIQPPRPQQTYEEMMAERRAALREWQTAPQPPSQLAHLLQPRWKREQPVQQLQPPAAAAAPAKTSSKNLLAKPRTMMPKSVEAAPEHKEPVEVKEEREDEQPRESNEHRYERFTRRLAMERRCSDWLLETEQMQRARDRSMPRRRLFTAETMRRAVEGAQRTRGHSHDGRWYFMERDPNKKSSRWFQTPVDLAEHVDDLSTLGEALNDSLCSNDSLVSQGNERELQVDRNKLVWQRGFGIRYFPGPGKITEYEIFTLQGRIFVKSDQSKSKKSEDLSCRRVKFAMLPNGEAIIRRASYDSSGLFTLNLRIHKLMKITSTAIVAYRHPASRESWLMWSDDIGLIVVSETAKAKYDNDIRRTKPLMVPLRVVQIKMQAEHADRDRRIDPRKWEIHLMTEMTEESELESLHDMAWPRLAQRLDDLAWVEQGADGVIHLRSTSFPDRIIHCKPDQWIRKPKDENRKSYRDYKFTAVMVPHEPHLKYRENYWQCLLLAPLSAVSHHTDDRIFNYRPLDALARARVASLPEGWKKGDPAPYDVIPIDSESR